MNLSSVGETLALRESMVDYAYPAQVSLARPNIIALASATPSPECSKVAVGG